MINALENKIKELKRITHSCEVLATEYHSASTYEKWKSKEYEAYMEIWKTAYMKILKEIEELAK